MNYPVFHYIPCEGCRLFPFCKGDISRLLETRHLQLGRGEILCWSQNKFQNLYAVQYGGLKTFQPEANGLELVRGFYFTGEIFGYEAIDSGYYPFSAIALCDTKVCEISYESLLEALKHHPELQRYILNLFSRQLTLQSYLQTSTAEQRLASFLIDLSERLHPPKTCLEFDLPMSRQDIGNYLRLTAETVSRICSKFSSNNIIFTKQKNVRLLNMKMLKLIAEGLMSVDDVKK